MTLQKSEKAAILSKFQKHGADTASPEVQIALITQRLQGLNEHFKVNKKDHHSKQGLMRLVGRRKRLLEYLKRTDDRSYYTVIKELGIRK